MRGLMIALAAAAALVAGCASKHHEVSAAPSDAGMQQENAGFENAKDRVSCKHKKSHKRHHRAEAETAAPAQTQEQAG